MPKDKATIRSKSCLSNNSKTTEANLTKLHRKIEHYGTVCPAQEFPTPKVKVTIRPKSCLSNDSKTTEANLTKLQRNKEHYEMVCRHKS